MFLDLGPMKSTDKHCLGSVAYINFSAGGRKTYRFHFRAKLELTSYLQRDLIPQPPSSGLAHGLIIYAKIFRTYWNLAGYAKILRTFWDFTASKILSHLACYFMQELKGSGKVTIIRSC